jgi:UDP-N-acetyl-2-amino-2-deoxyglucuronate dehydrogenase
MYSPIVDRKIKIAVVGCGRISRLHIEAINDLLDDFELVAVCDTDTEIVEKVAKNFHVNSYITYSALLAEEDLDIVTLCTPSGLHASQAIMAADAGLNVITEKPMATYWKDGLEMVKACDDHGVRLFVVKQNRNNPTLKLLKRAITE